MRTLLVCLCALAVMLVPAIGLAQTPQTYSMTVSMPMGPGTTLKIARDGSKESLEQIVPKSANGPGMHIRQIYDFASHRYWTISFDGSPCIVSTYTSPSLPSMFDPVSGADEMRAGLAQNKPAALRSEAVNGIATNVYELPVPEIKGKMRMFLEEKHNFAVKIVLVAADGKEQTQMEVKSLSFAKPPADLFVPPQNCRVQGGESSATGGHAETEIRARATGEKSLGEAQPSPRAAQKQPSAGPASRPAPAAAAVTEVRAVGVTPAHYTGTYPPTFDFTFSITANGPLEAKWVLVNQADIAWQWGTLVFDAAGTRELKVQSKVGVAAGTHWEGAARLEVNVGTVRTSSEPLKIAADPKAK